MDAKEIKRLIKIKDMTQSEFAEKLGVSQQVVNGWFARDSVPSKYINKIEELIGFNTELTIVSDNILEIKTITSEVSAGMGVDIDNIDQIEHGKLISIMKDGKIKNEGKYWIMT